MSGVWKPPFIEMVAANHMSWPLRVTMLVPASSCAFLSVAALPDFSCGVLHLQSCSRVHLKQGFGEGGFGCFTLSIVILKLHRTSTRVLFTFLSFQATLQEDSMSQCKGQ